MGASEEASEGTAAVGDFETGVGRVVGDGADTVGFPVGVLEGSGVSVAGESFFGAPAAQADKSITPSAKIAQKLAILGNDL